LAAEDTYTVLTRKPESAEEEEQVNLVIRNLSTERIPEWLALVSHASEVSQRLNGLNSRINELDSQRNRLFGLLGKSRKTADQLFMEVEADDLQAELEALERKFIHAGFNYFPATGYGIGFNDDTSRDTCQGYGFHGAIRAFEQSFRATDEFGIDYAGFQLADALPVVAVMRGGIRFALRQLADDAAEVVTKGRIVKHHPIFREAVKQQRRQRLYRLIEDLHVGDRGLHTRLLRSPYQEFMPTKGRSLQSIIEKHGPEKWLQKQAEAMQWLERTYPGDYPGLYDAFMQSVRRIGGADGIKY
jgi:hypothetical protein